MEEVRARPRSSLERRRAHAEMRRSVITPPFAPRKDLDIREAQAWAAAHAAPAVASDKSSSFSVPWGLVLLLGGIGQDLTRTAHAP